MLASEIRFYELLKARLGEKEAEAFVEIVEHKVDRRLEEKTSVFATKEDLAKLETRLVAMIGDSRTEVIKWMFIFWIGQLAAFIAIAKFILQ